MFGRTEVLPLLYGIIALSAAGAATDLAWGRIYNWMNLIGAIVGLALSFWIGGWGSLGSSLLAVLLGFFLYGWMFWVGAMSAGDVKFLMALGAWGGVRFVTEVALLGVLVGGGFSVVILLGKGRLIDFYARMRRFFTALLVRELEYESPKINHDLKMPFGVPIALAAVWVAWGNPFAWIGVGLWPR